MTPAEALALYERDARLDTHAHLPMFHRLAHGNVLEIGVFTGVSTAAFLAGLEERGGHLWSVDINPACGYVWRGHPQWSFIWGSSQNDAERILTHLPLSLDLLYVDGGHSYQEARDDLDIYGRLVVSGGTILVHDVLLPEHFPGVRRAFDEYVARRGCSAEIIPGSCGLGVIRV